MSVIVNASAPYFKAFYIFVRCRVDKYNKFSKLIGLQNGMGVLIMISMLFELRLSDKNQYGTKASALGELIGNGEEVPKGFALSSEFFMKFLEYNNFPYSTKDYIAYNVEIQDFVLNGQFSPEMEKSLLNFFRRVQNEEVQERYAVRSSALCEDNDTYSMAGMFSSFINLNSFEEVKTCIKKCYASLFTDKVIAYFVNNNLNLEELKMCVIIQQFVAGDYSGVNFSVDTIDMDKNVMHINAVKGLCEDYVSGKLNSAFYKINRKTAEILEERIPDGFIPTPKDMIHRLYESTLKIEKIFGKYQDIEWTILDNKIYILQARPITTFRIKTFDIIWGNKDDENYTWYRANDKPYEPLINELSLIQGEALNKGCYTTGFQDFYTEYCVQNGYFFYRDKEMKDQKQQEQNFITMVHKLHYKNQNIFQDIVLPQLLHLKKDLDSYLQRNLSSQEALIFLEKSIGHMKFLSENHQPVTHGCDYLNDFMEYCKRVNDDFKIDDFYDLVFNISILNKEREFYIDMANEINLNPILNKMFMDCQYNQILYARLKNIPESKKLLDLIENYITEFGICNLDSDVNSDYPEPLLKEAPSKVIGRIRGFLNLNNENFRTSIENSLKKKEKVMSAILSKLCEKESQEFLDKLNLAEKAYLARDNHHYYFERMTKSYLRLALLEVQRIMTKNKQIQNEKDLYFLNLDEIKVGLLNGDDFKQVINERKEVFNYQMKLFVPFIIGKEPSENTNCTDENSECMDKREQNTILKGLSGLRKKVNAKVKVGMPAYLEEDSILVLPFTRCGELEPIINHVKGIIVEVGSPFEHLGILARELDIPVLYNVKNAMSILKDGDEIQLDGFAGEVKIIKRT